jgi:hypothetical protein
MTTLEKLVRPFQSPNVTPSAPSAAPPASAADTVVIRLGDTGDLTTFTGSFSKVTTR